MYMPLHHKEAGPHRHTPARSCPSSFVASVSLIILPKSHGGSATSTCPPAAGIHEGNGAHAVERLVDVRVT
jgi:hypothetical protein